MSLNFKNSLDEKAIFWMAQTVGLVALINYASDLFQRPLLFSQLNFRSELITSQMLDGLNMYLPIWALICMVGFVLVFPFLENRWARILFFTWGAPLLYLLYKDNPGHNMHLLFWVLLYGVFLPTKNFTSPAAKAELQGYVRVVQWQILLIYSISGLWKLFYWGASFFDSNLSAGAQFLSYAIAQEFLNTGHVSSLSQWVVTHPLVAQTLSVMALGLQGATVFVLFKTRYYALWGVFLALFHVGTLALMNVFFIWPVFLTLIFLTLPKNFETPEFLKPDRKTS